jgi:hypothetical protein
MAGRREVLFDFLARGSRLPGVRMNAALADAFAHACRARGAPTDAVSLALARLSATEAPGATAYEFLPVCGVRALGDRAAADESVRARFVAELHARADDTRFRLREAVIDALSRIGSAAGDSLARQVSRWMDGYFHAAAVLHAMARDEWLASLHDADAVLSRLEEGFVLAQTAPRAAARWPGHKELLIALDRSIPCIAIRFGIPVFDMLVRWSSVQDPVLRDLIAQSLRSPKLARRFASELETVGRALEATRPPPRNPDHDVGPTRDRSRKRRRPRRT